MRQDTKSTQLDKNLDLIATETTGAIYLFVFHPFLHTIDTTWLGAWKLRPRRARDVGLGRRKPTP
jgi:hypothetical protein